ncbi:MAG TPA: hypothetical protein ENG70_03655 [Candidatus Cloacimonetes bacterium]|nr:hypothetical protein [Candidatus Cloacimonadota bacterium]HEX37939.1 hypothetical protein [Candidatus Cloacimonadota bacterium]
MNDEKRTKQELINELKWMRKQHHEYVRAENEQKKRINQLKAYEDYLSALIENKEEEIEHRNWELGERVKELNCLYSISNLIEKKELSLDEIFEGTIELIPSGWQYPEITYAKLTFLDKEYKTFNYEKTEWVQESGIHIDGEKVGNLQVGYLEEKPERYEGPFLKDERNLINAITGRMSHIIELKQREQELLDKIEFLEIAQQENIIGTCIWNIKEEKVYLNTEFRKLLDFEIKPEVDFIYVEDFFPSESQEAIRAHCQNKTHIHDLMIDILSSKRKKVTVRYFFVVKEYNKNDPRRIKGLLKIVEKK